MTLKGVCMTCDATWLVGDEESHRLDCPHHSRRAVPSTAPRDDWSLSACRSRAAEMAATNPRLLDLAVVDDRAQLLALVDRMLHVVRRANCIVECATHNRPPGACNCGLDNLLRDLDGDARGGGR